MNSQKREKIIAEIIKLAQQGEDWTKISAEAGFDKEEIKELLQTVKLLAAVKEQVKPSADLEKKILKSKEAGVTFLKKERYNKQQEQTGRQPLKGRLLLIAQSIINKINEYMNKKFYLPLGIVAVLVLLVGVYLVNKGGISLFTRQPQTPTQELGVEVERLNEDVSELEGLVAEDELGTLDSDLAALADSDSSTEGQSDNGQAGSGQTSGTVFDVSDMESLEAELGSELDSLSSSLSDLGEVGDDSSLDNLDSTLADIAQ